MMPVMKNIISTLVTGGGKITCKRCTAKSKRSGEQCKKPALKTSRTQKCEFHGYVLNMTTMPRARGRKPLGYVPLRTVEDVVKFALDNPLHSPGRSGERQKK